MNLNHLQVFAAVAETRSFTKAAERLGADKAHVSRVVGALERSLEVVLVTRTTRQVSLTPAGQQLFEKIAGPLMELGRASSQIEDRRRAPAGLVTLSTTPDLGRTLVAPLLSPFRSRFPLVRIRLRLEASVVHLTEAGVDLALRVGPLKGAVRARRIGELSAGLFASPRYLALRGEPKRREDLAGHDGLWPSAPKKASFAVASAPPPPAIDCDDFGALLELARAGAGIAVLPLFLIARDVAAGSLVRVLPEVVFRGAPLSLVTVVERPLPARVSALRDFLVEHLRPA